MFRRIVHLLLMPLMLANQGLCLAHVHHGTGVAEPPDHASRPHIHFGHHRHDDAAHGHDHDAAHSHKHDADHSHQSTSNSDAAADKLEIASPQLSTLAPDHEHDAVYFPVTTAFASKADSDFGQAIGDQAAGLPYVVESNGENPLRLGPLCRRPPSLVDADGPIFLRSLSLRL